MYSITRKSPLLLAAAAISIAMAGTASAQWRITRPGSYKLFFNHNVGTGDGIIIRFHGTLNRVRTGVGTFRCLLVGLMKDDDDDDNVIDISMLGSDS